MASFTPVIFLGSRKLCRTNRFPVESARRYTAQRSSTAVLQHVPVYGLVLVRKLYCKLSDVFALEARNIQFIL
jgi:hypothetical protein